MTGLSHLFGATGAATHLLRVGVAGLLLSVSTAALAQTQPAQPAQKKTTTAATPPAATATPTAAAAQPAAPASNDPNIVARAGDNNLTREEVRAFVSTLAPAEQDALAKDPALFSQTLRVILANQLVLKEAQAKKWQDQPTVAAQLQRVRDNAIVESYLQSVSAVPENFPSETDLQRAYEASKSALVVPRQFQVAQIFVTLPEGADKEVEERAKKKLSDVQAKLKAAGADFAAIAKSDSDERDSGAKGGEIGWLAENQIRPEIKTQIVAMANGAVSEPVKGAGGWHILKLLDTKAAGTATFAEVKDALAQRLRAQQVEANRRAHLAKLLEQSPPSINELALGTVLDEKK